MMRVNGWMNAVLVCGLLFGSASLTRGEETKIPLDKLPKAVLDTVKAKYPGAELKGAEKDETPDKTIYEVTLVQKGQTFDVSLTPAGKILAAERLMEFSDLPKPVQEAVTKKYPKAKINTAEEVIKDDKVSFEVILVTAEKKTIEVLLDPKGKILEPKDDARAKEGEVEISIDKLPKAVLAAVKSKYPGAELKGAQKDDTGDELVYEVSLVQKGNTFDVSLTPAGKIIAAERLLEVSDLPKPVHEAVTKKYPKAKIKTVEELTEDDKVSYEVILTTPEKTTIEVVLDAKGKILATKGDKEAEKDK